MGLATGDYILEFQFAETFFASAGQRRFDVHAEGQEIISNLDVFAAAGGKDKAYSVFEAVTVADGILNVRLETTGRTTSTMPSSTASWCTRRTFSHDHDFIDSLASV